MEIGYGEQSSSLRFTVYSRSHGAAGEVWKAAARNKLCFLPLSNLRAPPELRMGAGVLLKSLTNKAAGSNVETQWAPPAPWVRELEEC